MSRNTEDSSNELKTPVHNPSSTNTASYVSNIISPDAICKTLKFSRNRFQAPVQVIYTVPKKNSTRDTPVSKSTSESLTFKLTNNANASMTMNPSTTKPQSARKPPTQYYVIPENMLKSDTSYTNSSCVNGPDLISHNSSKQREPGLYMGSYTLPQSQPVMVKNANIRPQVPMTTFIVQNAGTHQPVVTPNKPHVPNFIPLTQSPVHLTSSNVQRKATQLHEAYTQPAQTLVLQNVTTSRSTPSILRKSSPKKFSPQIQCELQQQIVAKKRNSQHAQTHPPIYINVSRQSQHELQQQFVATKPNTQTAPPISINASPQMQYELQQQLLAKKPNTQTAPPIIINASPQGQYELQQQFVAEKPISQHAQTAPPINLNPSSKSQYELQQQFDKNIQQQFDMNIMKAGNQLVVYTPVNKPAVPSPPLSQIAHKAIGSSYRWFNPNATPRRLVPHVPNVSQSCRPTNPIVFASPSNFLPQKTSKQSTKTEVAATPQNETKDMPNPNVSQSHQPIIIDTPVNSALRLHGNQMSSMQSTQNGAVSGFIQETKPVASSQKMEQVSFLPEACSEVVVESIDSYAITNENDEDSRLDHSDTDHADTDHADEDAESQSESMHRHILEKGEHSYSFKRNKRKPNRLKAEENDSDAPSTKKVCKRLPHFNPCCVVIERLDILTEYQFIKINVKALDLVESRCSKNCKEKFLKKMCKQKLIHCEYQSSQDGQPVAKDVSEEVKANHSDSTIKLTLDFTPETTPTRRKKTKKRGGLFNTNKRCKGSKRKVGSGIVNVPGVVDKDSGVEGIYPDHDPSATDSADSTEMNQTKALIDGSENSDYSHSLPKDSALTDVSVKKGCTPEPEETSSSVQLQEENNVFKNEDYEDHVSTDVMNTNEDSVQSDENEDIKTEVGDALIPENTTDASKVVQDDSDDDWGLGELEVDPDSEPEDVPDESPEKMSNAPIVPVSPVNVPPESLFEITEFEESKKSVKLEKCASLGNPVLSEKVQRLKAMLEEQTKQVESLRKSRNVSY